MYGYVVVEVTWTRLSGPQPLQDKSEEVLTPMEAEGDATWLL